MKETDIVIRELTNEEIKDSKVFAHFAWEGTDNFAFYTISDGYWESAKILCQKMKEESRDFKIVDSLIYPMFFNYRHSIELFLKVLYFNLGDSDSTSRQKFLAFGHDLKKLWDVLRPFLDKGKEHVGVSVNLNAIEHYIYSINSFDANSMIMRYPIDKKLNANKSKVYHFDFLYFAEKMNELCISLRDLDSELSNQIFDVASPDELNEYLNYVEKYSSQIDDFLSILRNDIEKEQKEIIENIDFFTIIEDDEMVEKYKFLNNCDYDLLVLLDNLFYVGRAVYSNQIKLAIDSELRQKEFVKVCYSVLEKNRIDSDIKQYDNRNVNINIYEKSSSTLLKGISVALSIIRME